jgi:hypothetical protein
MSLHGAPVLIEARTRQDRLDVGLPDHIAHCALSHILHGYLGILIVKEIFLHVLDAPENNEVDIGNVLIARQDQAFRQYLVHTARRPTRTHADLDDVLARYLGQVDLLDGIRPGDSWRSGFPKYKTMAISSRFTRKVKE